MAVVDKHAFLARSWLKGMQADVIDDVAQCSHWRHLDAHERIFSRGDRAAGFYIIFSGSVRVFGEGPGEFLLTVLVAGMEFGEISILDGSGRTHSAESQSPTLLLCMSPEKFLALLARHPALHEHVVRRLCTYLRLAFASMEDDQLTLGPRLAKRLLFLAEMYGVRRDAGVDINLSISQEDLAHMLGTVRQHLGRHLGEWQRAGFIRQRYRHITITNEAALEEIVSRAD